MHTLPKALTLATAAAVLGVGALVATPAAAYPYSYGNDGNGPAWGYGYPEWNGSGEGYWANGYPGYGASGYAGYNGFTPWDYREDSGAIAVCPPGYHLGQAPGLCWPDR